MLAGRWVVDLDAPGDDDDAVVVQTTGWPSGLGAPHPARWSRAVLVPVHVALASATLALDPASLRLVRARLAAVGGSPPSRTLRTTVELVGCTPLADRVVVALDTVVAGEAGDPVARSELHVAGRPAAPLPTLRPPDADHRPAPARRAPAPAPAPVLDVAVGVSTDDAPRFAAWSGDATPFHTDVRAARAAGFAERVVPGFHLLALAAAATACATERPVAAVGARFTRPVVVGSAVVVRARADGTSPRVTTDLAADDGPAIRHGSVELA